MKLASPPEKASPERAPSPRRGLFALTVAVVYPIYFALYTLINGYNMGRRAHALFLPAEREIPLVPEFAYLYAAGFLLPLLLIRLPTRELFVRTLLAFTLIAAVAFATFLLFPVSLSRPAVERLPSAWLLSWIYRDDPYNDFPSLHVAVCFLVLFACRRTLAHPALLASLVVGISLSTIFVRQHYIVDVLAGAGLAWGVWRWTGMRRHGRGHRVAD